jgi:hypothetical protein
MSLLTLILVLPAVCGLVPMLRIAFTYRDTNTKSGQFANNAHTFRK